MNAPYEPSEIRRRNERDNEAFHSAAMTNTADEFGAPGVDKDSPGVRRMEAITSVWSKNDRYLFIGALIVMTYFRTLAAVVLGTYQSVALSEFALAGQSGMVRTVRQVLAAASLPIAAKLSDYVGRTFVLVLTALFWAIGPALFGGASGLGTLLPGFLLYTLGHVCGNILSYALAIDTSSLRNRLFMQLMYIFPAIINVWASGVVAAVVVNGIGWRWGAAMWSFIAPACTLGVAAVLGWGALRARRQGLMDGIPSSWQLLTSGKRWLHMFWVMDIPGLLFLAGSLALILLPLSLGGSSAAAWKTARVITPLVIGVLLLPVFAIWEHKYARHPLFPFRLMKDRHVMLILIFYFVKSIAGSTRDAYLYYTLVVSFNQGTEGATRINSLESFAGSFTLIFVAIIVRRWRVVKPLIIAGAVLMCVAQGMLVHFRGGYGKDQLAGLIAGEILDGIGVGLSTQPSLVAMQAKLTHEHALLLTSCWAVGSQAGAGIAAAISGAVWTSVLPGKLREGLLSNNVTNATTLAAQAYNSPLAFVTKYAPGTIQRDSVVNAYRDVQWILCVIGVVLTAILIPMTFFFENVSLDDHSYAKDTDTDSEISEAPERRKNSADAASDGRQPTQPEETQHTLTRDASNKA